MLKYLKQKNSNIVYNQKYYGNCDKYSQIKLN